jgi:uncharacterized membrane protein YgcG
MTGRRRGFALGLLGGRRVAVLGIALFGLLGLGVASGAVLAADPSPGPPFPPPEPNRAVYDAAGILSPETEEWAEATIDAIEERTGAEVVVYTQVVDPTTTTADAEAHAIALMDEWGIGRAGIDDGLVLLIDLYPDRVHGQVQLYAGPGYRAAYLTNEERQRIFEEAMLPRLRAGDFDGAVRIALERVDAAATADHAAALTRARTLNAILGLAGAPTVFFLLVGWGLLAWTRYGRDPEVLDSPSIYLPGPPAELTPAGGALIVEGRSTRRALTAALLDLASRGLLSFEEVRTGLLGRDRRVAVDLRPRAGTDLVDEHRRRMAARRRLGPAETFVLERLRAIGGADERIEPDALLEFGREVGGFEKRLEADAVARGWFREPPKQAVLRWVVRATGALIAGFGAVWLGATIPMDGLVLVGLATIAASVVLFVLARAMPARTLAGAMLRAMLAAYRRTLAKTMETARSMDEVVASAGLEWLETPDAAVVWGVALGLGREVEAVLERSVEDLRAGRTTSAYVPSWYASRDSGGGGDSALGPAGRGGGLPSGLASSSPIPNVAGMLAVLGTVGNAPGSSGGGGGFGGGGSGGGGGGAGGGF